VRGSLQAHRAPPETGGGLRLDGRRLWGRRGAPGPCRAGVGAAPDQLGGQHGAAGAPVRPVRASARASARRRHAQRRADIRPGAVRAA
ncbi:hypothetical protein ABTL16_19570, partial [Acinetobacter baumannii]